MHTIACVCVCVCALFYLYFFFIEKYYKLKYITDFRSDIFKHQSYITINRNTMTVTPSQTPNIQKIVASAATMTASQMSEQVVVTMNNNC